MVLHTSFFVQLFYLNVKSFHCIWSHAEVSRPSSVHIQQHEPAVSPDNKRGISERLNWATFVPTSVKRGSERQIDAFATRLLEWVPFIGVEFWVADPCRSDQRFMCAVSIGVCYAINWSPLLTINP